MYKLYDLDIENLEQELFLSSSFHRNFKNLDSKCVTMVKCNYAQPQFEKKLISTCRAILCYPLHSFCVFYCISDDIALAANRKKCHHKKCICSRGKLNNFRCTLISQHQDCLSYFSIQFDSYNVADVETGNELTHPFAYVLCMLFVKIRIKDQIFEKFATLHRHLLSELGRRAYSSKPFIFKHLF
ncbi:hypothetical protein LOAG_09029 [Loa loa]|uniref:Uncharacterized protein n=1 Tax=Loa loa TaxID=7209 RepID=A0A1S0TSN6_LOALO|nr:hypothetical protein LOAG_09029 [Loa loa]EFO19465.1 hypothetical protein LOAG_09029 [Loa loa]